MPGTHALKRHALIPPPPTQLQRDEVQRRLRGAVGQRPGRRVGAFGDAGEGAAGGGDLDDARVGRGALEEGEEGLGGDDDGGDVGVEHLVVDVTEVVGALGEGDRGVVDEH